VTEAELQSQVIKLAHQYSHLVFHCTDSRKNTGDHGFPDLVIVGRHRTLFAELKDAGNNRSSAQTTWYYRLIAVGEHYCLWRPNDLESGQVETILAEL
jgi:hypothetical protein